MGKTFRKDDREDKEVRDGERTSHHYEKECGPVKVHQRRSVRKDSRKALRTGNYDSLPTYVKTGGWESN